MTWSHGDFTGSFTVSLYHTPQATHAKTASLGSVHCNQALQAGELLVAWHVLHFRVELGQCRVLRHLTQTHAWYLGSQAVLDTLDVDGAG